MDGRGEALFTGLIECIGEIRSLTPAGGDLYRIGIFAPKIASALKKGDSVAVSGACLTVAEISKDVFYAQMMRETLDRTRLGWLGRGDRVNLERALQLGGRLDGHVVAGHVDAVGTVAKSEGAGSTRKLWIDIPADTSWGIVPKGSVAVDGTSLTVIDAIASAFSIGVIPTTMAETTVGSLRVGDPVNIEIDVLARYVARMLQCACGAPAGERDTAITWDTLQENGWL